MVFHLDVIVPHAFQINRQVHLQIALVGEHFGVLVQKFVNVVQDLLGEGCLGHDCLRVFGEKFDDELLPYI